MGHFAHLKKKTFPKNKQGINMIKEAGWLKVITIYPWKRKGPSFE